MVVAVVVAWPTLADGQGLRVGAFRLVPSLTVSAEYTDNVILAPRETESDFTYTITPGLALEYQRPPTSLSVGYRADILRYLDRDEFDTVHHTVLASARTEVARRLKLSLADQFRRTTDFVGQPVPELAERVARLENALKADVEYAVAERFGVGLGYQSFLVDYRAGAAFDELDRQDHVGAVSLFYQIFPRTSLFVEYGYQIVRYDIGAVADTRDSEAHRGQVGVRGDLTAKTTLQFKTGAEFKDFDDRTQPDSETFVVEGEAIYRYREPSQLRVFVRRANLESTATGTNTYVATYGGLELQHALGRQWLVTVVALGGVADYPEPTTVGAQERVDRFYAAGLGIRYQFRPWLGLEVGYQIQVRNSNIADFDFTENRVRAGMTLTY